MAYKQSIADSANIMDALAVVAFMIVVSSVGTNVTEAFFAGETLHADATSFP